jgi:hypothetical protein
MDMGSLLPAPPRGRLERYYLLLLIPQSAGAGSGNSGIFTAPKRGRHSQKSKHLMLFRQQEKTT